MSRKIYFVLFAIFIFSTSCQDDVILDDEILIAEERQRIHINGGGWDICSAIDLRIFVEPCLFENQPGSPGDIFGEVWEQAVTNAIQNFNAVDNSIIRMSITEFEDMADIRITCTSRQDCFGAIVGENFEFTGFSPIITVNQLFDLSFCDGGCNGLDVCSATGIIMHELAHAVGVFHNDSNSGNSILVDGTPVFDPNSIFNSGDFTDWCNVPCVFTADDIIAIQSLYPAADLCDCDIVPSILGPDNLCANEEGEYCIVLTGAHPNLISNITWRGHPDIEGSTNRCIKLSYDTEGVDFIYANVQIGGCNYFSVTKRINIGSPNILDDLTVEIDPCRDIINIDGGNKDVSYSWGEFNFSYNASPHVSVDNNRVRVRAPLLAGEEFCFRIQATNECGTSYLPCDVCYTIPSCIKQSTYEFEKIRLSRPNNACNADSQCPDGYTCQDGICCEKSDQPGDNCITNEHCPKGFKCVFGDCCHIESGLCL